MMYPSACMQHNSYSYANMWYEWKVEGDWFVQDVTESATNDDEGGDY